MTRNGNGEKGDEKWKGVRGVNGGCGMRGRCADRRERGERAWTKRDAETKSQNQRGRTATAAASSRCFCDQNREQTNGKEGESERRRMREGKERAAVNHRYKSEEESANLFECEARLLGRVCLQNQEREAKQKIEN